MRGIETTKEYLKSVTLPNHKDTYTVISHGFIIDKVADELKDNGFTIERELYYQSADGEIAQGNLYITTDRDKDMGMLFTWQNSYNKQVKFSCGIGAYVYENEVGFCGTEGLYMLRKHTGDADKETLEFIEDLIQNANVYFDKIIDEKDRMKLNPLTLEDYSRIMGALYFEHELLTPTQASLVRKEYKKPTHDYDNVENLWGLYKLIMFVISELNINQWQKKQQKLHHLIMTEYAIIQEDLLERYVVPNKDGVAGLEESIQVEEVELVNEGKITGLPNQGEVHEDVQEEPHAVDTPDVQFRNLLIEESGCDTPLLDYFMKEHYNHQASEVENMITFNKFMGNDLQVEENIPASEPEIINEVSGIEPVEITTEAIELLDPEPMDDIQFTFPTDLDKPETIVTGDSLLEVPIVAPVESLFEDVTTETVEAVEVEEEDFLDIEEHQGLEVPAQVIKYAAMIEKKMLSLYGSIQNYDYTEKETLLDVELIDTKEKFYVIIEE